MMSRHRRPASGFTLVEALIAMTITAIALIACLKAAGNLNLRQDELIERQYAQWSVQNIANFLRVAGVYPQAQIASSVCNQGRFQLTCQITVSTTPNPNFRRIEIVAQRGPNGQDHHQLARLVVFLSNAP